MILIDRTYVLINDLAHFFKSGSRGKARIILSFAKLSIKAPFARLFGVTREKFLGFRVHASSYSSIKGLYQDIFLKALYHFDSQKNNPVIIDAGANIGFAALYWKWLYPKAKVYCFEPAPGSCKFLDENIKANKLRDVEIINKALWKVETTLKFYTDDANPSSQMNSVYMNRHAGRAISVKTAILSKFISSMKVDLLKIDIEGAEGEVMAELYKSGKMGNIKEMIIEYHHGMKDAKSKLGEFLLMLERSGFDYQIDAACVPISSKRKYQDVMVHAYRR